MTTTLEPSMGKMSARGGSPHHPEKHLVTLDQAGIVHFTKANRDK